MDSIAVNFVKTKLRFSFVYNLQSVSHEMFEGWMTGACEIVRLVLHRSVATRQENRGVHG
jgi:hypothetical protein